jgi:hypothetical protein
MSSRVCCIVEGGHGFCPFGNVVENDYNILVPIVGWGIKIHEINAPLIEVANGDN